MFLATTSPSRLTLRLGTGAPPRLVDGTDGDPNQPHQRGHDAVRGELAGGDVAAGFLPQSQAEAAVDHAEGDQDAAEPEMDVGDDGAAEAGFEEVVVDDAAEGLDEHE